MVAGFLQTLVYQGAEFSTAYAVDNLQGIRKNRPNAITLLFSTTASLLVEQNSTVKLDKLTGSPTPSMRNLSVRCEPDGFISSSGIWARESGLLSLPVVADTTANSMYNCTVVLDGPLQAQLPPTLSLGVNGTYIFPIVPETPGGKGRPLGLEVWCAPYQAPANGIAYPEGAVKSLEEVTVTCKEGYLLRVNSLRQNSARVSCRRDGTWSSLDMACERMRGTLFAFGRKDKGQLGDGTIGAAAYLPAQVTLVDNPHGVSLVTAGETHSMALTGNGTLYTWGSNDDGQLGCTSIDVRSTPGKVDCPSSSFAALNFSMASAGKSHSVVLGVDGSVWCWGSGRDGQLGHGSFAGSGMAVQPSLPGGTLVGGIAAGEAHTLAVNEDGSKLYSWGSNTRGQLGDGSKLAKNVPVLVSGISDLDDGIVKVAAGTQHSFALLKR